MCYKDEGVLGICSLLRGAMLWFATWLAKLNVKAKLIIIGLVGKKHQRASLSVLELLHGDAKCSGDVIWILKQLRERTRCCWLTFSGFVIPDAGISFTQDAFV